MSNTPIPPPNPDWSKEMQQAYYEIVMQFIEIKAEVEFNLYRTKSISRIQSVMIIILSAIVIYHTLNK